MNNAGLKHKAAGHGAAVETIPRLVFLNLVLCLLYIASGKLGLMLGAGVGYATAIWPPSGISLGMMLLYGYRVWPGVFLGALGMNMMLNGIFYDPSLLTAGRAVMIAVVAAGATLQTVLIRFVLSHLFSFPLEIERPRDAFLFLMLAAPLGCLVSASIANTALYVGGVIQSEALFYSWLTWWLGDCFGVLAFMPITLVAAASLWPQDRGQKKILYGLPFTALLTLVASIVFTFIAWRAMVDNLYEKSHDTFENLAVELEKNLLARIESYEKTLLGAAGFVAGSDHVSREEWQRYASWVNIEKNFPGMNGIGFIRVVDPAKRDDYIKAERVDMPDFDIHPPLEPGQELFVITYIEPYTLNKRAIGLNIAHERNRHEAAVRARDTGHAAITRRVQLIQDAGSRPGFLLLYPFYERGKPLETEEERRAAFLGWIYAPVLVENFMRDLVSSVEHDAEISLEVYDGDTIDPRYMIFNSDSGITVPTNIRDVGAPMLTRRKLLNIKQQQWTVVWKSAPALESRLRNMLPLVVLFGGMTFTALLAMFLTAMSRRTELVQHEVDRKAHEITASEARMRTLVRHTPAAIAMFDRQMRYIMASDRWLRDYNLQEKDIIGKSHYEVFPDILNMPEWMEYHQRGMKGEAISLEEDIWTRGDGTTEWLRWSIYPWRDSDGYIGGIIMFTELITEQKRSRSELIRSNTALEEFAYVVSHDLKAPVRHMGMCAEFLQQAYGEKFDEEGQRFLRIIVESSAKMRIMIESLLDYARIGVSPDDFRDVDLEKVLESAKSNLTATMRECGAVVQSGRLPTVRGVEGELLRVFQNLLENAIKYRAHNITPQIRVDAIKDGKFWRISVADNGIGIDPRYADKIFLLFQRLHGDDSPYTGQGIGLSICQRIVRYHGGEIQLDRSYQNGSRFILKLPDYAETISSFEGDASATQG